MKLDYKLNDAGVNELRINIIREMAKQHQRMLRRRAMLQKRNRFLDDEIKDVERFFLSSWGQLLSGDCGEYIIEKDREVVREEMERRKKILG